MFWPFVHRKLPNRYTLAAVLSLYREHLSLDTSASAQIILQMYFNYQNKTFAGTYKLLVLLTALQSIVHIGNMVLCMPREWVGGVDWFNLLLLGGQLWQVFVYRSVKVEVGDEEEEHME